MVFMAVGHTDIDFLIFQGPYSRDSSDGVANGRASVRSIEICRTYVLLELFSFPDQAWDNLSSCGVKMSNSNQIHPHGRAPVTGV